MTRLRLFFARTRDAMRRHRLDRDLRQQIASHLDEAAEEYVARGFSPDAARREALRSFGGIVRAEEAYRDVRSFLLVESLWRDVRHAARALRRNRGFSAVVLIVLSVAVGALTAIFALLNAVILRPLPYAESDRLAIVGHRAPGIGPDAAGLSSGLYFHYAEHARSLESIAVYRQPVLLNLRLPGSGSERVHVTYASAGLFKVLRTTPEIGRLFTEEDGRPGFMNMRWQIPVLLSHDFWVSRFGADPAVVGRVLSVNDSPREVVGVLPKGFSFPRADIQMWVLIEPTRRAASKGPAIASASFDWNAVARLREGTSAGPLQAELAVILRQLEALDPESARERLTPVVVPLKSAVVGDAGRVIWLLFGGMSILLFVACANAGGLFLARAEHRIPKIAMRRALGADGFRLATLFFIEALLLTAAAAAIGVLLASGILSLVLAFLPFELPRAAEIELDGTAMLFAAAVAVAMAAFYGALSVRRQGRSLTAALAGAGRWGTGHRGGMLGGDGLIVLQVALALTLMVASMLMVKTYRNLSQRELGFAPGGVLAVEVGLQSRKAGQHVRIFRDAIERVSRLPRVESASLASFAPLTSTEHLFPVEAGAVPVAFKFFAPGYFQAMGTPILEGDAFASADRPAVPFPVLVSAALARRLYPGERAVGKPVRRLNEDGSVVTLRSGPVPPFTIAGIVADVREVSLRDDPSEIVYIPIIDPPSELSIVPTRVQLILRSSGPLAPLAAAVRQAVAADPDLSVGRIQTMDAIVGAARGREAFVGTLLLLTAAVSLLLGTIGVYGSVAQVVRRRTREIAIRVALGARGADVIWMVATGSIRAVVAGSALGLVLSLPSVRFLRSLLFGVDAHDPIVFAAVIGTLLSAAGAAAFLAARHAAIAAPLDALRGE